MRTPRNIISDLGVLGASALICVLCTDSSPESTRMNRRRILDLGLPMDFKSYKLRLQKKERELLSDIGRFEREAREAGDSEVGDPTDRATTSEGKSTTFGESTLEWQTLVHVREALQRIEDGSFGKCVDCGRPIEPARLEAIPWTPYCREDQEKHNHAAPALGGSTL